MELLQLRYFVTVAHLEHMTKAAEMLCISQPSLSRTITNLEKELNIQLFEKNGRNIRLTSNGHIFLKHIERIFFELEEATREIGLANEGKGEISIGTVDPTLLSDIILEYDPPNIQFKQHLFSLGQITELLDLDGITMGIACFSDRTGMAGWTQMFQDQLYAVVPRDHPFSRLPRLTFTDISSYDLAMIPQPMFLRRKVEALFVGRGLQFHVCYDNYGYKENEMYYIFVKDITLHLADKTQDEQFFCQRNAYLSTCWGRLHLGCMLQYAKDGRVTGTRWGIFVICDK